LPVNFSPWVSKFHNFDVPSIIGCDLWCCNLTKILFTIV
jgi:hypothetical protein